MEKMLAVIVDDEAKAYEVSDALDDLVQEGDVSIYEQAIIQKSADGTISTKQSDADVPIRELEGTAIGAMIGLLGGPVGVGIGSVAGGLTGGLRDLHLSEVSEEFIDDVSAMLTPGKFAVIADIDEDEDWVTPVDVRMEALGGTVLRAPKKSVEAEQRARLRDEFEQAKAELTRAHADRKP